MSKNKHKQLKKRIAGLQHQIDAHRRKIEDELKRPAPYHRVIRHWLKEVGGWEKQIESCRRKLPGRSR